MIGKMNHVSVFVLNQESAHEFYVNKLGFTLHTDAELQPGMRWLTVCPPGQPDFELALLPVREGMMMFKGDMVDKMRELIQSGTFGFGVFECDDLDKTYGELLDKGVHFNKPPTREQYAYQAIFTDDSGNWFALSEKPKT